MDHHEYLVTAERKYALLLGRYEVAEHATEVLVGVKAVAEADVRIQKEKKKLKAEMARIADTLRRLCDPEWTPGHLKPLHPHKSPSRKGEISKLAYKIMRKENRPMGSRELAKMMAPSFGLVSPGDRELMKLDVAVRAAFAARVKAGQMILHPTKPMTWSIKPLTPAAPSASASVQPTPADSAD